VHLSKIISDDNDDDDDDDDDDVDVIPGRGTFPYKKDGGAHRNLGKNAYEIPRSGFVGLY